MADKRRLRNAQLFHKVVEQLYLIFETVPSRFFTRIAKAPQIQRVGAILHAQLLHRRHPIAPRTEPPVNKDHRAASA
jgi:hypothetical protein